MICAVQLTSLKFNFEDVINEEGQHQTQNITSSQKLGRHASRRVRSV